MMRKIWICPTYLVRPRRWRVKRWPSRPPSIWQNFSSQSYLQLASGESEWFDYYDKSTYMTCRRVRVNVKSVTCDSLLRETCHTITAVGWGCSSIFNFLPNQVNKRNQKDDVVNHKMCFDVDLKRPNYKVAEAVKNALKIVQIYFDKQLLNKRHNLSAQLIGNRCRPCLTFPQNRLRSRLPGGNREVSSSLGERGSNMFHWLRKWRAQSKGLLSTVCVSESCVMFIMRISTGGTILTCKCNWLPLLQRLCLNIASIIIESCVDAA